MSGKRKTSPPSFGKSACCMARARRWPVRCPDRDIAACVLPVAEAAWRDEPDAAAAAEGTREGEPEAAAGGVRPDAREADPGRGCPGKLPGPPRRRECAEHVRETLGTSERRACRVPGQPRSTQRKPPQGREDEARLTVGVLGLDRCQWRSKIRPCGGAKPGQSWAGLRLWRASFWGQSCPARTTSMIVGLGRQAVRLLPVLPCGSGSGPGGSFRRSSRGC